MENVALFEGEEELRDHVYNNRARFGRSMSGLKVEMRGSSVLSLAYVKGRCVRVWCVGGDVNGHVLCVSQSVSRCRQTAALGHGPHSLHALPSTQTPSSGDGGCPSRGSDQGGPGRGPGAYAESAGGSVSPPICRECRWVRQPPPYAAVSYTHLTLPTIYSV